MKILEKLFRYFKKERKISLSCSGTHYDMSSDNYWNTLLSADWKASNPNLPKE